MGKATVCFDFNGVLLPSPGSSLVGDLDVAGIVMAQQAGCAVAVTTCNNVRLVAARLRHAGVAAVADPQMRFASWDGDAVLVTNRKIVAAVYIDDRVVRHTWGQSWDDTFARVAEVAAYLSCAGQHWGARGAAGLLAFAPGGEVLLTLRAAAVQDGGTWSIPGGALGLGESTWEAAFREMAEELAGLEVGEPARSHVRECPRGCGWAYTTFAVPASLTEVTAANWESAEVRWVPAGEVAAMRLHPAFAASWPELHKMVEAACAIR